MNRINKAGGDRLAAMEQASGIIGLTGAQLDALHVHGKYRMDCTIPVAHMRREFADLRDHIEVLKKQRKFELADLHQNELLQIPQEIMWKEDFLNLVVTVGKNDMLDKYLAGSAYTAAFYMGLISSASYTTGVVAADTMASHAGWTEAAGYSNANRPTAAWSAAAAGVKALSAGLVFNINASATIKGAFLSTNNVKSGTTGILFSGGLFTGGDQPVVDTNTLTATYQLSA